MKSPIYFVAGKRTPFVKAGGVYAKETALTLSAPVMQAMADEARADLIVWGQVIPHATYSNIAREAALDAGIDAAIPSYSTQLACSTGMAAAIQAAGLLGNGGLDLAMVGGVEQMSRVPVALEDDAAAKFVASAQAGPAKILDALASLSINDLTLKVSGRSNRISGRSMGDHMEETAKKLSISRDAQDQLAYNSHTDAHAAIERGFFDELVIPMAGVTQDSIVRADTSLEKLASLKPVFDTDAGTLTAGNSSPLTDGAAALWVANAAGRARLGASKPAVRLVDYEFAAVDFLEDGMLMAPAYAIPRLLARHKLRFDDIALWEIHEAFAAQVLANIHVAGSAAARSKYANVPQDLGEFPLDRLNPNGGSLALGHPFAATGARILSQAVHELHSLPAGSKAIVSICADGGQGTVVLLENTHQTTAPPSLKRRPPVPA